MKKLILAGAAALGLAAAVSAQPVPVAASGGITRAAALADAERQFAALDANGNGQLEAAEMQEIAEQRRAQRRARMEERLAQMSPEQRAEFEQRRAERRDGNVGERGEGRGARRGGEGARGPVTLTDFKARAGERFDRLDPNHDGVITQVEQAQLRAQRGRRTAD